MDRIAQAPKDERADLFRRSAGILRPERAPAIIEKDFWVCFPKTPVPRAAAEHYQKLGKWIVPDNDLRKAAAKNGPHPPIYNYHPHRKRNFRVAGQANQR